MSNFMKKVVKIKHFIREVVKTSCYFLTIFMSQMCNVITRKLYMPVKYGNFENM